MDIRPSDCFGVVASMQVTVDTLSENDQEDLLSHVQETFEGNETAIITAFLAGLTFGTYAAADENVITLEFTPAEITDYIDYLKNRSTTE